MPSDHPPPKTGCRTRNDEIAALHRMHAGELRRRVAWRTHADPQTVEDACSHAWLQLLTHPSVDLTSPDWSVLGWLTLTATREARRLDGRRVREGVLDPITIDSEPRLRGPFGPAADELADQHARLDVVAQIPQRPRRFLLQLALGFSYREIAVREGASMTTTNKQIARAKRLLRALDAPQQPEPSAARGAPAPARQLAA
jgi:DNA-directed RNA polymerase specialized sigma24 family protein